MTLRRSILLRNCWTSSSKQQGFSLIEVLITLAIISILTALVMVRYGSFNSAVLLKNQAFEIALDLRETQVFSISVRGESNEFREEYGVYFNTNSSTDQEYIFWQDAGSAAVPRYNSGEEIQTILLDDRFEIIDMCVNGATAPCGAVNPIHISFARPNFDAKMRDNAGNVYETVEIIIAPVADTSITRSVFVTSTGQITVE